MIKFLTEIIFVLQPTEMEVYFMTSGFYVGFSVITTLYVLLCIGFVYYWGTTILDGANKWSYFMRATNKSKYPEYNLFLFASLCAEVFCVCL